MSSSSGNRFNTVLLPLIFFPALSAIAVKFIFLNNGQRLSVLLNNGACDSGHGTSPYLLPYTGYTGIDFGLCHLVTFFHAAMEPPVFPILSYFFYSAMPPICFMMSLEAYRRRQHWILSFPLVFGLLYQTASFGFIMPLYWLAFILSGATSRRAGHDGLSSNKITQAHAHAATFGLFAGAIIPTFAMFHLKDPYVTVLWQPFPLWTFLAEQMHLLVRQASRYPEPGYPVIRAVYILLFIACSIAHILALFPLASSGGVQQAWGFFKPSLTPVPANIKDICLDLLKWDVEVGSLAGVMGSLWFGRSGKEVAGIAAWHILAIPTLGPGAAMAAVALWRESYLNQLPTPTGKKK